MSVPRVAAALALIVSGGLLGAWSDTQRPEPRPEPGLASLLGGFSAIAVQVVSLRAENALAAGDEAEALLNFDLIVALEPQLVGASDWIAHRIGVNMAGDADDPEARWALAREGLEVHDRAVAANPSVAQAWRNRALYTQRHLTRTEELVRGFLEDRGLPPNEAAAADFQTSLDLEPESLEATESLGIAALYAGRDRFLAGDYDGAAKWLQVAAVNFQTSIDAYNAGGQGDTHTLDFALQNATGLRDVCRTPVTEREAAYRRFWAGFEGMERLPGLPAPE